MQNREGRCYRIETRFPVASRHGHGTLEPLRDFPGGLVTRLSRDPGFAPLSPDGIAWFDTETTGLGGAGTRIFLAGVGRLASGGDAFHVVQFLLYDDDGEAALLHALFEELSGASALATYNGKRFN